MGLKAKILLIMGIAVGLTLVTLFIFFRQEFITSFLWVVGIIVFLFLLFAWANAEPDRDEIEVITIYYRPIYTIRRILRFRRRR